MEEQNVFLTDCQISDFVEGMCFPSCGGGIRAKTRSILSYVVQGMAGLPLMLDADLTLAALLAVLLCQFVGKMNHVDLSFLTWLACRDLILEALAIPILNCDGLGGCGSHEPSHPASASATAWRALAPRRGCCKPVYKTAGRRTRSF